MTSDRLIRRVIKPAVFVAAVAPGIYLTWAALTGNLSANPLSEYRNETGVWTLRFLCITLAVTPLRRLTGWNGAIKFRRMLGLFAFFYATLHFLSYWAFDLTFAFGAMVGDILTRPFIALGFAAFVLLIPLALTSTKGWIRRLGKKWALLHRLVYVAAICAVIHFAWKVKVFTGDPVIYAAILALL